MFFAPHRFKYKICCWKNLKLYEKQQHIPEILNSAPDSGMLSMANTKMIPVLTKATQEINDIPDTIIQENNTLTSSTQQ